MKKIYFWLLSVALIYSGIYLHWIGARGAEISTLGALGFMILLAISLRSWLHRNYWTPAWVMLLMGLSIYELGRATEYVDANGLLHESLPFLAGGAGFVFLGIAYAVFLILRKLLGRLINVFQP